jgi:hypothetical protein
MSADFARHGGFLPLPPQNLKKMGYCCSLRVASVGKLPLTWSVIELAPLNGEPIVTVRFRGRLSVSDLTVFETALLDRHAGHAQIRVLFDWTGVEGWEPGTGEPARWPNWRAMARPIDRAAIIHEHRWNRQAALLAAMLRINKAQARSWLPRNLPAALVWLNEK